MSSFKLFFNLFSLLTQCGNICSKSTSVDCWSFIHLCPIRIWKIIRLSCCRCWSKNISRVKRKNVKFSEHQSELIQQCRLLGKIKSKVKYKNTSEISVHRSSEEYLFSKISKENTYIGVHFSIKLQTYANAWPAPSLKRAWVCLKKFYRKTLDD